MEKFVIIDGNNLMFRAFYALPQLANFDGEISNAVFGFTNMLVKVIKEINPKYIAVTFDVAKKNFRHEKFAEYKGTRKPTPPELISQFPIVKDLLNKMKIKVVEKEGLEADDLIGCLSKSFDTENIIVSADRDAFQLISSNTRILFPKKGITETIDITKDNLKELYGVEPYQVIELKSLMGDASDNIPGVSGVGEKTAIGLLDKYETLDGVYSHIEQITGKLKEKLVNDKEKAYLSKFLATIVTDEKLEYSLSDFEYEFPFNSDVVEIFKRYQFNSLLKREDIFDNSNKITKVETPVNLIKNNDSFNSLIESMSSCNEFSFFIDEKKIYVYTDKEYEIFFGGDLIEESVDFEFALLKLKPYLEDERKAKILFDAKAMMHILSQYDIKLNGVSFDLLVARYLINSIAKPSVSLDDIMTECGLDGKEYGYIIKSISEYYYAKLEKMNLLGLFNDIELPLIEVLFSMEMAGFKVDKDELKALELKYSEEITIIENSIYDIVGHKFNIASPKQLGEVLFDELNLNIPSNKKKSTSIEILNEIADKHEIVPMIIRYRTITKLYSTYIIGFAEMLSSDDKIHTVFHQTLTSTGRLSSSEPNLQNIPVRTEEGRNLRKVFIPSSSQGYILSADYSQIELRLLADFSGDDTLINAFNSGQDIHARTASEIWSVPIDEVSSEMRRNAKAINFGIVYGISDFGLSQNIGSTRKEASEYIKTYFNRYPKIDIYMKKNIDYCKEYGYIKTLFGRIRPIPEITSSNFNLRTFGERAAMNMPLQGSASDIIKLAMVKIYNQINTKKLKSKIILQVHDELVIDVEPGELEIMTDILKKGMEEIVDLKVKLLVNVSSGKTWYDAK